MKPLNVEFRPTASEDIDQIFQYIFAKSKNAQVAGSFIQRIRDRCVRIGQTPKGGRLRDDLEKGLRTIPFEKIIVIAYVIKADCVWITNIFYGGRDYEALYRGAKHNPAEDVPPP